jgi:nucleoside-diphosphate-sugar epimerase
MNTRRRADPTRHRGGDSDIKRLRILHSSTSIVRGVQASSVTAPVLLLFFILTVFTSQQPTSALRFFNLGKNKQKSVADNNSTIMVTDTTTLTVFVAGATGATGKHVVQQLLDKGHKVKTIVRSQERMMAALKKDDNDYTDRFFIKQASLLDMTDEELAEQVSNVDAVVSCLGHTLDFQGMYGYQSRHLVLNATRRLTTALLQKEKINDDKNTSSFSKAKRFILMNTEGVVNPAGTDDIRPFSERVLLAVIRFLVPPHRDNEAAAQYVYDNLPSSSGSSQQQLEWVVIRPTDLINENKDGSVNDKYRLTSKPIGSLFGAGIATRSNVARSMVDLLTNNSLWEDFKFQMPCICDAEPYSTSSSTTSSSEEINIKEQEL